MKWYCIRPACLPADQVKDMLVPDKCESASAMEGVAELPDGFREATITCLEYIRDVGSAQFRSRRGGGASSAVVGCYSHLCCIWSRRAVLLDPVYEKHWDLGKLASISGRAPVRGVIRLRGPSLAGGGMMLLRRPIGSEEGHVGPYQ